jgi:biotin synthase
MKRILHSPKRPLRFKRWTNKGYAAFNSVRNEVVIRTLSAETATTLLPKSKQSYTNMSLILELEKRVLDGGRLDYEEALLLTEALDKEALYSAADRIRARFHGNQIDLCSIVNARSGRCSENCKWCSQSKFHHTDIEVYDLIPHDDAVRQALLNEQAGVNKFSLVTSGRTISHPHLDQLCKIYDTLRRESRLELCASMGLLDEEKLQKLYDVGVRNYHCNIETAPSFFPEMCTTHTIEEKKETLRLAQKVGMKRCSGGIIGMGESMAQRVEMAMALQEIGAESIPINVLNPIPGTPLADRPRLSDEEILTTMAVFRFVNPRAWIRFAGGRTLILRIQDQALHAGINATIVGDMLTTKGITMEDDIAHLRALGFEC